MERQSKKDPELLKRKELVEELNGVQGEIAENFHKWQSKEITSQQHSDNDDRLFEEKRKLIADIRLTYKDDEPLWL